MILSLHRHGLRKRALVCGALWALAQTIPAHGGGVHLDGSLGQSGALPGPNYMIPAEAGKQAGGNLFHSFSQFDLSQGEVATFLAPVNSNAPVINNILARITGGSASSIDGTIRSDISGANLFLINPNGFMFGPHASLDISGSFTATSASTVKLGDGAHFDAHPGLGDLTLSSAPVSAFGFVATSTTRIDIASTLSVPTGQSLSIIGGHNINITAAHLSAPSGQIAIVSNSSASDVSVNLKNPHPTGTINESSSSILDASGTTGGKIVIRAGSLTVQGASQAFATTEGSGGGGGINIKVSGTTTVKGQSRLFTLTTGAGIAGNLTISSGTLNVSNSSVLGSQATNTAASTARAGNVNIFAGNIGLFGESEIAAASFGAGRPGNMTIVAKNLTMSLGLTTQGQTGEEIADITDENGSGNLRLYIANQLSISNGASISTSTFGRAKGGDLTVSAGEIYVANSGPLSSAFTETGIFADSSGSGRGGDIHLQANDVTIASGGLISTRALSSGNGGTTNLSVNNLTIDRNSSPLFTGVVASAPLGTGNGGDVHVFAQNVSIFDGGEIAAETSTTGNGGQVTLQTNDLLLVGNNSADIFTGITGNSLSPASGGASGGVNVTANTLEVFGGARISADTFGSGAGGNVNVTAGSALISDSDSPFLSGISAASLSESASGHGGKITASFGDLTISGSGAITASTSGPGNAGDISVTASTVKLLEGGQIFADTNGAGNGGIVNLSAKTLSISGHNSFGNSGVFSNTNAQEGGGLGGSVTVKGKRVTLEDQGAITAISSGDGKGGSITLHADTLSLSGGSDVGASSTRPTAPAGDAGSVMIDVSGPMTISSGASVSTISLSSNAGTVAITAPNLSLNNGSITVDAPSSNAGQIELSVARQLEMTNSQLLAAAENAGGNITVDPMFFLLNDSVISANASAGRGGNILLVADFFFRSDTQITATGSQNGTVNIAAPELDLTNGLVTLPSSVIDASTQIREQCAQRLGLDFSSFLVLGRGSVDVSPDEAQTRLGAAPASQPQKRKKR